jgi:hypothetical protein
MTVSEKLFHAISKETSNGVEGKMFGAKCIKSRNGKTAAFFWKGNMVFKLDEKSKKEAFNLKDTKIGVHLYAPEKQMKGWVSIPYKHSGKWAEFTKKALIYVETLKK